MIGNHANLFIIVMPRKLVTHCRGSTGHLTRNIMMPYKMTLT